MERVIINPLDLLIISETVGHTQRLPAARCSALRSTTINYVIVTFASLHLISLVGASVSLLPASSLRTEAWLTVADWRQRQSLWGHLLTDTGEAGVWLGRAEL